jgi:hypothetical protein
MIENVFRRIALAQGLLPAVPSPALRNDPDPVPEHSPDLPRLTGAPADNPAMVEQQAPSA